MSNPLALLPLAIAAGGGRIGALGSDEAPFAAQQFVAAGLTLLQRSVPLVRALSGRRSAVLLPTSPAFLTALAASDGRGAVLVNPLASPVEIALQCRDANVGAVFTIEMFAPRVPQGLDIVLLDDAPRSARVIHDGTTKTVDLGSHHGLSLEGERDVAGRDEEAVIVYTSAMRGRPLGAVLTHANMLANARSTTEALQVTADDHVLALLPYSHLFGLTVTATAPLMMGARVTTVDRFNPIRVAELLASGITVVSGVPGIFAALLTALTRRGIDLRGTPLRLCICGGAVLPRELQDRWAEATGSELRQGYGLTEAAPVCLFNRMDEPNVRGALGYPFPGVDVKIFPPADYGALSPPTTNQEPLTFGSPGEICVRGPNVFPGYLNGAEGLPMRGEWLCTGDEGVQREDGCVTFLGLLKPMFTRNGFNIYPLELERAVMEMPGVVRATITGIPEASRENDIHLRVAASVTREAVERWCADRLSAYKQPSVIEIEAADG